MTFAIEIVPSAITSPIRIDLAAIEAAMLWPDDELRRARFRKAATVETIRNWAESAEDGPLLAELIRRQDSLPSIAVVQPDQDRPIHGRIAGKRVLDAVLSAHHSERPLRLGEIDDRIAKELKRLFQVEPQTLKNKTGPLTKFRPVAHLWAAHLVGVHEGREQFPCPVCDLARFLATAEAIRAMAETTRLPNSHHTIMRPGEAVTLPDDVRFSLPKIEFIGQQSFTD
jgi:hypothetical protein